MFLEIIVLGGYVLQRYGSLRGTHDVDTLSRLDDTIKELISDVGLQTVDNDKWLNDDARTMFFFDESLPEGWEERARKEKPVFVGDHGCLIAYPLSKRDLMLTKLFALFTRKTSDIDKDIKDLKTLKIEFKEILDAVPDLHEMLSQHHSLKRSPEAIERFLSFLES